MRRGILDLNLARRVDTWVGLLISSLLFAFARLQALRGRGGVEPRWATTPPGDGPPISPRRVLAIKFYGLGNIVMLLPVLQALRDAYPEARIDFLTLQENGDLLERSGLVESAIGLRIDRYGSLLGSLWSALRLIRRRRPDVVIDFEQFIKLSGIVAFVSGARHRIGFNTDGTGRGWLYTARVVYADSEHMSRIFLRLLGPLRIAGPLRPAPLSVRAEERTRAAEFLRENEIEPECTPVVVVHVGSGANFYKTALKRWPVGHFAELCDGLAERYGAAIVLTGKGRDEHELVAETARRMRHRAANACDLLSLGELVALLSRCRLLVSNDTSVMHLAAALGVRVVAFFGPTSPIQYGPGNAGDLVLYRGIYCSPCLTNYNYKVSHCGDPVCMRTITPAEVLGAIEQWGGGFWRRPQDGAPPANALRALAPGA